MTHRIYLRGKNQKTAENTTTESITVAAIAYLELILRADLVGSDYAAAWTKDGGQLEYFTYPKSAEPAEKVKELLARAGDYGANVEVLRLVANEILRAQEPATPLLPKE